MKEKKLLLVFTLCIIASLFLVNATAWTGEWKPTKPITVIIPWAAGGASDLIGRMILHEMEPLLGQSFVVVNTPGSSGAIGTHNVWLAPHDGYTWTANAAANLAWYPVLGYLDVTHREWEYFLPIYTPNVIVVNPKTPYQDIEDLVEAMKENPGKITVASAGVGSSGFVGAELFANFFDVEYRHVPYEGGNPAVIATVSGESEVTMQLSTEVADMLRAGKLRAIATMGGEPLEIFGYGTIPPIQEKYPDFPVTGFHFGIMIPKDVPSEVITTVQQIFAQVAQSETVKKFAEEKGAVAVALYGEEADQVVEEVASVTCWVLYDSGAAERSPEEFGIPRL